MNIFFMPPSCTKEAHLSAGSWTQKALQLHSSPAGLRLRYKTDCYYEKNLTYSNTFSFQSFYGTSGPGDLENQNKMKPRQFILISLEQYDCPLSFNQLQVQRHLLYHSGFPTWLLLKFWGQIILGTEGKGGEFCPIHRRVLSSICGLIHQTPHQLPPLSHPIQKDF